jgi:glycosyltransferase involved in cell wall biosynthesis
MRIGIDARELCGRPTGVGRVLAGLLREWSQGAAPPTHDFVLYSPHPLELRFDARRFRIREIGGASGTWWEQVQLPQAAAVDNLDVFFAPAYTSPLRIAVPVVATIHDLSYFAHPEWFRVREGIRRRWLTEKTAAKARAIITVSEFSRAEIVERLGVPEDRVHIVPQGIDRPAVAAAPAAGPRVLYVGSIFNRRHVGELVRAVGVLARSRADVSLDVVGDDRTFPPENLEASITRLGLEERVRWHRFVSDAELGELYGRATAFGFLSEYEGLGMTPLEALAAGVPPVLYDTAVARESCGDAGFYVRVGDSAGVVEALDRALFDEDARARVLAAAPATLARYDWGRAARDTLAIIEGAA